MSTAGISANKLELLSIANAVAQEKSIDKSESLGVNTPASAGVIAHT